MSSRLNADLFDENYAKWLDDPLSIDSEWASFFNGFELGSSQDPNNQDETEGSNATGTANPQEKDFFGKVVSLIYNYRTLGHTQATINPLNPQKVNNPRLSLEQLKLKKEDMSKDASSAFFRNGTKLNLGELIELLDATYSGSIGFEFMHIHNTEVRNWIRELSLIHI